MVFIDSGKLLRQRTGAQKMPPGPPKGHEREVVPVESVLDHESALQFETLRAAAITVLHPLTGTVSGKSRPRIKRLLPGPVFLSLHKKVQPST